MTREITIHGYKYSVNISEIEAEKIINSILKWMENHNCSCGESLHQNDDCLIEAPSLVSDIIDNILKPTCLNPEEDF